MNKREKEKHYEQIGDIQFWNETVVYYRNKKDKSKTIPELRNNLELLEEARTQLTEVERRILGLARTRVIVALWIITALVLISIVCCSCSTINGFGKDLQDWTSKNVERSK